MLQYGGTKEEFKEINTAGVIALLKLHFMSSATVCSNMLFRITTFF